jgi:hypothetical protein
MLHADDLPATALIQPASRVTWRLAVAAPEGRERAVSLILEQTEAQIKSESLRGVRVESMESGRPEMRQTLQRAEMFLNLVALLAALLAAVAVAIASRDFADRHLDDCAMLRVLGLPQRRIAWGYALEFLLVGLVASVAGLLLGWFVHHVFVWLLSGLVSATLPAPGWQPAAFGLGVGMTLLMGFGLPPVLQLASVPPLRVMRRDVGAPKASSLLVLVAAAGGVGARLMARGFRRQAGRHCRGWFCRRRGPVCAAGLGCGEPAQTCRAGSPCTALAGAGHPPAGRAPGLCRVAGVVTCRRLAGPGAAGAAAHRPHRQLAPIHAARCAQPFCHQHPA